MANPHPIPNFKPGQVANPNGRPVGSRNKRTKEIIQQIMASGDKDPLLTLSELQATAQDESIRATAANMLAPYLHGKVVSRQPKYIEPEAPLDLPKLDSLANAVESIARIKSALLEGKLSTDDAQQLIAVDQAYISGLNLLEIESLQERLLVLEQSIAAQPASSQTVAVVGGMPALPGTNITMPQLNGREVRQIPNALDEPSAPIEEQIDGSSDTSEVPTDSHPTPYYRT
jgi:hypothetical protein